jgi:hypothetical protein
MVHLVPISSFAEVIDQPFHFVFCFPLDTRHADQGLNPAGELSKMTLADLRKKFTEGEDESQMLQVLGFEGGCFYRITANKLFATATNV